MNYLMVDNLKSALEVVHLRMAKIEKRRKDYKKSRSWAALKVKEQIIEEKIKKIKENTKKVFDKEKQIVYN